MSDLFDFQLPAFEWLKKRRHGLLALEMGMGKTAIAIKAADHLKLLRVCVVCPAAARINWEREFAKFSIHYRTFNTLNKRAKVPTPALCTISSYDLAPYIHPNNFYDLLIIDESHFLKSVDAKRTLAIFGRQGLCRRAKYIWALSGTPAPNHPAELWPLLYTFKATSLTYDDFVDKFCTSYSVGAYNKRQITGARVKHIPELRKILGKVMFRQTKEKANLPPILFDHIWVAAGNVDYDVEYVSYMFPHDKRAELFAKIEHERNLIESILKATKAYHHPEKPLLAMEGILKSVATYRRFTGLQKVDAVAELVKGELEANAYEKIVIFAIHQGVIEGLRHRLTKFGAVTLYGNTPPEKRQRNIDEFQKNKRVRVFIGNIHAAGTAITLTASNQVLFAEQDWVPGNNAQAAMRCHRIGQKKTVNVRFVGLANSIDEKIMSIVKQKTVQLAKIFDDKAELASAVTDFEVIDDTNASGQIDSEIADLL